MCQAHNEKRKEKISEWIELLNQENIIKLGDKETYKYLGILEADKHQTSGDERKN